MAASSQQLLDTSAAGSAEADAAYSQFSIDDYGRVGDQRPYQIVEPSYPAPSFLSQFMDLGPALRECSTLCSLKGRPFRVVRWGREGAGNRGGVPCKVCKSCKPPQSRFPRVTPVGFGFLEGFPDAMPIAEYRPNGQRLVFDKCGQGKLVGSPNYVVSHTPFIREHDPQPLPQRYLEAVRTGQLLANRSGKRTYVCSDFGAPCDSRNPKRWVPVVYVNPGGLTRRHAVDGGPDVRVTPVSPSYYRELVAESRGATLLGQGA